MATFQIRQAGPRTRKDLRRLDPHLLAHLLLLLFALLLAHRTAGATRYVSPDNPTPQAPYTTWGSAARTIQEAIDKAAPGDEILVTNGVYATGGRAVNGGVVPNRIAVTKPVTIRSLNGPEVTVLQGEIGPTYGSGSVRCAYLTNGAALLGFTLTHGATQEANFEIDNSGAGAWCESEQAILVNCVIVGNSAQGGEAGGVYGGTLTNCLIRGNSARYYGGGAFASILHQCRVEGNSAGGGAGIHLSKATDSTLTGNQATWMGGGGASDSTLERCLVTSNGADQGGGLNNCSARACSITRNTSTEPAALRYGGGGGAYNSMLTNCTLTGNVAASAGAGAYGGTLENCLVYFNTDPSGRTNNNHAATLLNFSCTTPLPTNGIGNIEGDPLLSTPDHLSSHFPCVGAGRPAAVEGTDLDGEPWLPLPSIGCDEVRPDGLSGALQPSILADRTTVTPGFPVRFTLGGQGRVGGSRIDFGDGTTWTNHPLGVLHIWQAPGDYRVDYTLTNDSLPLGVTTSLVVHVIEPPVYFVDASGSSPSPPYSSWATAALTIQEAVNLATIPGSVVMVADGVYSQGGAPLENGERSRVSVQVPIEVRSLHGPEVTVIEGSLARRADAVRCVHLAAGALLDGFTLRSGGAEYYGGGVLCDDSDAVLRNCVLTNNVSQFYGGGAFRGTLERCLLEGNAATGDGGSVSGGGGARECRLIDCRIIRNSSYYGGGGVYSCTLSNCVLLGNTAETGGGAVESFLTRCRLGENSADGSGGGAWSSTLDVCALYQNRAGVEGGGAALSTLTHCTVLANTSMRSGGGVSQCGVTNSIVYFNEANTVGPNHAATTFAYSCTSPLPPEAGNIDSEPGITDYFHLSPNSPCRGKAGGLAPQGPDLDGNGWSSPPSLGCHEPAPSGAAAELQVSIRSSGVTVVQGWELVFRADIEGSPTFSRWDFGDGTTVDNRPMVKHAWATTGTYTVSLTAYDGTRPEGRVSQATIQVVEQPVHYVVAGNPGALPPYSTWATAAPTLQEAVDAVAIPGSLVRATNGVYQTGGRAVFGGESNRLAVTLPMAVQSVNGPAVTVIVGERGTQLAPGYGYGAVRGVYLVSGARLQGFTVTNGSTTAAFVDRSSGAGIGGGVWCESPDSRVSDCVVAGSVAYALGSGIFSGRIERSTLLGNNAAYATLSDCTLAGGSLLGCTASRCLVTNAPLNGATSCRLDHCTLAGNRGDGAAQSTIDSSVLSGNGGAGATGGTLRACRITGNTGPGVQQATLTNCTITLNKATGAIDSDLLNCIVYGNTPVSVIDPPNYRSCTLNYSCTQPLPPDGEGNIDDDPQLGADARLTAASPCRQAGAPFSTPGLDFDDEPWGDPPSIGCDEFTEDRIAGPLSIGWTPSFTTLSVGTLVSFTGHSDGLSSASRWEFGDGVVVSNRLLSVTHAWSTPGDYAVVLRAFNLSHPEGIASTTTVHVVARPVHYVAPLSPSPTPPYSSWETAARTIQEAVDAATIPGALVLVTNGVYRTGGRVTRGTLPNRVAVTLPIHLESVNGASNTVIQGSPTPSETRCLYLRNGASVAGFTLTGGTTLYPSGPTWTNVDSLGAGVWAETQDCLLSRCVLSSNFSGLCGGGVAGGTLEACRLEGNQAGNDAGGASGSILRNCLVHGNTSGYGGGAEASVLVGCTVTGNEASDSDGCYSTGGATRCVLTNCIVMFNSCGNIDQSTAYHSCITPLPGEGYGNVALDPLFVDPDSNDYRLQPGSPCINAGDPVTDPLPPVADLAGLPRIAGGTVDMGAFEFQSPASAISYAWLQGHQLPTDGSADLQDPDADGMSTLDEWRAGTDPNNAASALRILAVSPGPSGVDLVWSSEEGRRYLVEGAPALENPVRFRLLRAGIRGMAGRGTLLAPVIPGTEGKMFYRIRLQE